MEIRAVIDTNVVVARFRSSSSSSPSRELFKRLRLEEFKLLYQEDIFEEYAELLIRHRVELAVVRKFLKLLREIGQLVEIEFFHVWPYPEDLDDVIFLLCALNGDATHLVTHDDHLTKVAPSFPELTICAPVPFLQELRG